MAENNLSIGYKVILLAQNLEKIDDRISTFTQQEIDRTLETLDKQSEKSSETEKEFLEKSESASSWQSAQKVTSIIGTAATVLAIPVFSAGASTATVVGLVTSGALNVTNEILSLTDSYQTIGSWISSDKQKAKEYGETIHTTVNAICFFVSLTNVLSYGYQFFSSDIPPVANLTNTGVVLNRVGETWATRGEQVIKFTTIVSYIANMATSIGSAYYAKETAQVQSEAKKIQHSLMTLNQIHVEYLERFINEMKSQATTYGQMYFLTSTENEKIQGILNSNA